MTPLQGRDGKKSLPPHNAGPNASQDRKRSEEENQHHPESHVLPHPAHPSPQDRPAGGSPRHYPHTQPKEHALNTDHGTHEDRPRPGKMGKTGKRKE